MMELFHFLRPLWLLALPLIGLVWWLVRRHDAAQAQTGTFVAPHLREALTINSHSQGGFRPVDGIGIVLVATTLAAAGPSWSRQPSPWFAETAPLVIAIEVSDSMRSNDFPPTRLDRARFKVLDLIAERTGSRTALIAYAGSAHIVVPPSTDPAVIKPLLESLDPAIMPEKGAEVRDVLPLAKDMLGDQSAIGTLLFINDGFAANDISALAEFSSRPDAPALAALIVGSADGGVALMPDGSPVMAEGGGRLDTRVDEALLRRVGREANVAVVRSGAGNDDIHRLLRVITSKLQQADDPDAQWNDQGWWLLWPALLLSLLWFRRGWTMRW